MLEAAFELDRTALVRLLQHRGRWDSEREQQRIDAYLVRDGYITWAIAAPSSN